VIKLLKSCFKWKIITQQLIIQYCLSTVLYLNNVNRIFENPLTSYKVLEIVILHRTVVVCYVVDRGSHE
jgi:hypothetical protein